MRIPTKYLEAQTNILPKLESQNKYNYKQLAAYSIFRLEQCDVFIKMFVLYSNDKQE